jgi:regulatory protein
MPRITEIKQTKKGRYALFLDGEFAFSLDEETFADAHLHEDDELDGIALDMLRGKSDTHKALDKAMDLLSLRDHAAGELYQKLCRKFDEHSAAAAVAKAQEYGLLDDTQVARRRAVELMRKHKSRREISRDLAARGIERETVAAVLEELSPQEGEDPDLAAARALVEKQYLRKLRQGAKENVCAALARHGFSHSVIRTVVQEYEAGETERPDWE